jgi:hypothetical protein
VCSSQLLAGLLQGHVCSHLTLGEAILLHFGEADPLCKALTRGHISHSAVAAAPAGGAWSRSRAMHNRVRSAGTQPGWSMSQPPSRSCRVPVGAWSPGENWGRRCHTRAYTVWIRVCRRAGLCRSGNLRPGGACMRRLGCTASQSTPHLVLVSAAVPHVHMVALTVLNGCSMWGGGFDASSNMRPSSSKNCAASPPCGHQVRFYVPNWWRPKAHLFNPTPHLFIPGNRH